MSIDRGHGIATSSVLADSYDLDGIIAKYEQFADTYLGHKAVEPTTDDDGDALIVGALYFNTVDNELRVYDGTDWQAVYAGALKVNNFTGDGATVAYTLTTAPNNENSTQVYIDGVYQQKDTYTTVGATLTFSEAPPTSAGIEVMIISSFEVSTADAQNVTYTQGGTGASSRTVENKLQERVSCADFGKTEETVNQLQYCDGTTEGAYIETLGYYSAGDGGGGTFYWDATSTATDDGGTIIKAAPTTGRWLRVDTDILNPLWFGATGDGVTDDTVAWTAWNTACHLKDSGDAYIPLGTYLIDSWTITGRTKRFNGASASAPTLSTGVTIKCRAAIANFVTIGAGVGIKLSDVMIDGNNLATNTVRMTNNQTDTVLDEVRIYNCVDSGVNLNLSGITLANQQISELKFYGIHVGGRDGGSGITNILINTNQALVISFYNLKCYGNNNTDVDAGLDIQQGTCTLYTPFFVDNKVRDIILTSGSLTVIDGRSESTLANSIYIEGGAGDVTLINYVHASTIAYTTLSVGSLFTGRAHVIGGQFTNITMSATTGSLTMSDPALYTGGGITGSTATRIIKTMDGAISVPVLTNPTTTLVYGVNVSTDASVSESAYLLVSNGTAFTMDNPTNGKQGQDIEYDIQNGHSGAMGAVTWGSAFKLAGAFTTPATGKRRIITFRYDGASWVERNRTAADGDV